MPLKLCNTNNICSVARSGTEFSFSLIGPHLILGIISKFLISHAWRDAIALLYCGGVLATLMTKRALPFIKSIRSRSLHHFKLIKKLVAQL